MTFVETTVTININPKGYALEDLDAHMDHPGNLHKSTLDSLNDGYILTEVRGLRYTFLYYGGVV